MRRLLDILYSPTSFDTPKLVVSMDAEKAFDRVDALKNFGFGSTFISWIKLLYISPLACVRTNNDLSDYFPLKRGTQQDCPLSPLLFTDAIEHLAVALRSSQLQGVSGGGVEHKLSLYADNLFLFISSPDRSVPLALNLLKEFGQILGYRLNYHKSEFMPVSVTATSYPLYQ